MQFRIPLPPLTAPRLAWDVSHRYVLLGSCFAEHIGEQLAQARLQVTANPLGPLYSPAALCRVLSRDVQSGVVEGPSGWHTWISDTTFTRSSPREAALATTRAVNDLHQALGQADHLILTLGTARTYRLRETGEVVVNCHKHPSHTFEEEEQSVSAMADALDLELSMWHLTNPRLRVTLTVSPYRYAKYGMHASQLSKARLLLLCEELQRRHPEWVDYFPAYELLLDDLRDYRFYASDMLHPSPQAVAYIWERLHEWMTAEMKTYLQRWQPLAAALNHRPLHPDDPRHTAFLTRTRAQLETLQHDYPYLPIL